MTPTRRLSRLAPLALVPALLLSACTTSDKTETTLAFIELVSGRTDPSL
jgi:major membrane immunogen (membrane-anchored lipoprotein)